MNYLVEPKKGTKWPKKLPRFENRQDAIAVCKELCNLQFLLRCERRGKGDLGVSWFLVVLQMMILCYLSPNDVSSDDAGQRL